MNKIRLSNTFGACRWYKTRSLSRRNRLAEMRVAIVLCLLVTGWPQSEGLCRPGEYGAAGETCYSCMSGKFSSGMGMSVCSRCVPGSFAHESGMDSCVACEAGSFQFAAGMSSCVECPSGTAQSGIGSTSCAACPAGSAQNLAGRAECVACGSGHYASGIAASFCLPCESGFFLATSNGTACEACAAGSMQSRQGGSACHACSPGSYQPGKAGVECHRCGPGTFQAGMSGTACVACGPGTAHADTGRTSVFSCIECLPGTFASGLGGSLCLDCAPGTYQAVGRSESCKACAAGTFEEDAGSSVCDFCPAGTVATGMGGAAGACLPCKAGTYGLSVGASEDSQCLPCRWGYFSAQIGQSDEDSCKPCAEGSYAEGGDTCQPCGEGTFCPAGTGRPIPCDDRGLVCNGTSMGAHVGMLPVLVDGNCTGALVCPGGTRCSEGLEDKGVVDSVPKQTHFVVYAGGPLSLKLSCGTVLRYGYRRVDAVDENDTRRVLFRLLPAGCDPGKFLLGEECQPCPAGTFSTTRGALAADSCRACAVGSFSAAEGSTRCWSCVPGMFQAETGGSACALCGVGSFQDGYGSSSCEWCHPGSYMDSGGGSACHLCPAGLYSAQSGSHSCQACNGTTQFSSAGDTACYSCGQLPRNPPDCLPDSLPNGTSSVWMSVDGRGGDECLGVCGSLRTQNGVMRTGFSRLEPDAWCRVTLRVLGRPELSTSVAVGPSSRAVRHPRIRVFPFNETVYPAQCVEDEGFAVLYDSDPVQGARFEVLDPAGEHLLFHGSCVQGRPGICVAARFCPTQDVLVRVVGHKGGEGSSLVRAGLESLQCPPTDEWAVSLELRGAYGPRFPGSPILIDVRVLRAPDRLLAFRLSLALRPGFSFISFETGLPGEYVLTKGGVLLSGDASGAVVVGGLLGQLRIGLDAEHAGMLRVLQMTQARLMVAGGWYSVGVLGLGGSCLRNGFLDVLTDYPRHTGLIVFPNRTRLVHWRGVQSDAAVFPMRVDVLGVWNTRRPVGPVDAVCVSKTTSVLDVSSCHRIVASGAGVGVVLVRFGDLEVSVTVEVLLPENPRARFFPDAGGGLGRLAVSAGLLGRMLDITPFVFGHDVLPCRVGENVSVGSPVLYHMQCGSHVEDVPDRLILLSGTWTRRGGFRFESGVLSVATRQAGLLFFRGGRIVSRLPASEDSSRMRVDAGCARLVQEGQSPRCVGVGMGLWIPVLPSAPVLLEIRLSGTVLVVQQDLFKLVPSRAELVSGRLVLTDGSRVDVASRLILATSGGLRAGAGFVESMYEPGSANVTFDLPGVPCVSTTVNLTVFVSSVVSSQLECPRCPTVIAERRDPLSQRWQTLFPSRIPVEYFVVRRRLVDGGTHDGVETPRVDGAGVVEGQAVVGTLPGVMTVSTAFTPGGLEIWVIRRWATSWRLLCNGRVCDARMKLAPPGDGAGMAPFRYATRMQVAVEATLFNGSVLVMTDPPEAVLLVNGQPVPFPDVQPQPGRMTVQVVMSENWNFSRSRADLIFEVQTMDALELIVPPVLKQLHCARVWERGELSLRAVLSDGVKAAVSGVVRTDGTILRLDETGIYVEAMWPGEGWVNATFGKLHVSKAVLVSMRSLLFSSLVLDAVPGEWLAPLLARRPMHATLESSALRIGRPDLVRKIVRWQVEPEGVLQVSPTGELVLLSDHYEPVVLTGVIRSCQGVQPLVFRHNIQVNVVADQPWQVDFGQDGVGPPLQIVPEGGQLSVPVFLFCVRPLTVYRAMVSLPGLRMTACTEGELPRSECVVQGSTVLLQGNFEEGRRVGRILLGILHGTVLVSGLSRLRVSLAEPVNTTYEFTVRFGDEPVHSVLSRLNTVTAGFKDAFSSDWDAQAPSGMTACCDVSAVSVGSSIEHLVPSSFRLQNITLQPGNVSVSLTDPRLSVQYDKLFLDFDASNEVWTVKKMVSLFEDGTKILLDYRHQGAAESVHAEVNVALQEPEALLVAPGQLLLRRIHCSNERFQTQAVAVSVVLRGGESLPLGEGDLRNTTVQDTAIARVVVCADGLLVTGLAVGNTSISLFAFYLSVSISVTVLDESVTLASVHLPDPYSLKGPVGVPHALQISGVMEDGQKISDASFLVNMVTPSSPVARWAGQHLVPLENTVPGEVYSLVVVVQACANVSATVLASGLSVRLEAGRLPDVEVEREGPGFKINLVAEAVLAFLISLDVAPSDSICLPGKDLPLFADCAVEPGRIVLAGCFEEPRSGPVSLAVIAPMPRRMSGYVELFSGLSGTTRVGILAGRLGTNVSSLPGGLPVVDPATLGRCFLAALARPWDAQAMREANFTLQLLTGRQRLVDPRLYSNEHELSAMFGVTDRFLMPDEDRTTLEVIFHTRRLPPHPDASPVEGGVRVRARHLMDGWYVVQWAEPIPHLELRISYEVATTTSLGSWPYVVQDPLVTGRPLHECPRLATDRASFLVSYDMPGPVNLSIAQLACMMRAAHRRVSLSEPDTRGVVTATVAFESFIRIAQGNEAIQMKARDWTGRRLLQNLTGVVLADVRYINDTADAPRTCPPGTFYTKNGTYQRLPLHAVLGPDCYGMACMEGYLLSNAECVPAPVPSELLWVSVVVILGILVFLSCMFCALCLGRRRSAQEVDLVSESWPGSSHPSEPFDEDDRDFKNIVLGMYLDDYSKDMLDDDLNPADASTGRGKCRDTIA